MQVREYLGLDEIFMTDLSPQMQRAVEHANERIGRLHRHPGGYWNNNPDSVYPHGTCFGNSTIEALVKRGAAVYIEHRRGKYGDFPITLSVVDE